jgi:hypothetical protein
MITSTMAISISVKPLLLVRLIMMKTPLFPGRRPASLSQRQKRASVRERLEAGLCGSSRLKAITRPFPGEARFDAHRPEYFFNILIYMSFL